MPGVVDLTVDDEDSLPPPPSREDEDDVVEVVEALGSKSTGRGSAAGRQPLKAPGAHEGKAQDEDDDDELLLGYDIQRVAAGSAIQGRLSNITTGGAAASIGAKATTTLSTSLEEGNAARGDSHHLPGRHAVRSYDMLTGSKDEGDNLGGVLDDGAKEDDSSADEAQSTGSATKKGRTALPKRSKDERIAEAAAKKREKELKKEAKKQEKARKDQEKEKAQLERKEHAFLQQQTRGSFKEEEITLVMEMELSHTETGIKVLEVVREKYNAMAFEGMGAQGVIRWTHRPKGLGGAGAPGEVDVEDLCFALVLWRASHFLDLLDRGLERSADETCKFIQQELERIRGHHPCMRDGRLVLVLQGVQERLASVLPGEDSSLRGVIHLLINYVRRFCAASELDSDRVNRGSPGVGLLGKVSSGPSFCGSGGGGQGCVSSETLEDVVMWLLLEQDVDVKMTKDDAESSQYVLDVTRSLAQMPYRDKATDLQSVVKVKLRMGEQDNGGGDPSLPKVLSETWCRQLVQVPGLSEGKARSLMVHCPTLKSLLDEYHRPDLSEGDKQLLLQHKLTDKGPAKAEKVLSKRIYTLYVSSNPEDPCG